MDGHVSWLLFYQRMLTDKCSGKHFDLFCIKDFHKHQTQSILNNIPNDPKDHVDSAMQQSAKMADLKEKYAYDIITLFLKYGYK